jgi:hypothetical protein
VVRSQRWLKQLWGRNTIRFQDICPGGPLGRFYNVLITSFHNLQTPFLIRVSWPIETVPEQLAAFVNFTSSTNYDPYASLINSFGYAPAAGAMFVESSIVYTAPVVNPPAFQQYTSITPQVANTMRISNLSDFALEINQGTPYGFRQIFYTGTYANDLGLLTQLIKQLNESMQPVNGLSSLDNYAMSLEPLPTAITKWGPQTGGNALGLDPSDGDLVGKCCPCHLHIRISCIACYPILIADSGSSWSDLER